MKLPVRKPVAMGALTKEEIDAEIGKGIKSIEEGRVYSADTVEAEMMRDFGV
jgi:predicted transcriptional regulator